MLFSLPKRDILILETVHSLTAVLPGKSCTLLQMPTKNNNIEQQNLTMAQTIRTDSRDSCMGNSARFSTPIGPDCPLSYYSQVKLPIQMSQFERSYYYSQTHYNPSSLSSLTKDIMTMMEVGFLIFKNIDGLFLGFLLQFFFL